MELKINDCFGLLWAITIFACLSKPYTEGLRKLPQGSMQGVHRAYEETTMVKDIFIESRQNADAEYSEVYKMTEEMANTAVKVISVPRRSGRQIMRKNVEADTPEIY